MPPWLLIWIARLASGERFRNATPKELRWFGGLFALVPLTNRLDTLFFEPIPIMTLITLGV
jgi:hypothetical protein